MPYVEVTIPSASVVSTLTNFPSFVDLSDMPAAFWSGLAHDDGGDIRVKDGPSSGDTDLAFDIVSIDAVTETGGLFVKVPSVSHLTDTTLYIHYGNAGNTALAVGAVNGRNAVWSDYHRVFMLGLDGFVDHTGNGTPWTPTPSLSAGNVSAFAQASISPDVLSHQGVTWDGTHYYTTDTNAIRKWDSTWTLIATNADPCGDTAVSGLNHCGDLAVVGGVLYVPIQDWTSLSVWGDAYIARFNASDLSFIGATDISTQAFDPSSLAYVADEDAFYCSSYSIGTTLWKYDRIGLTFDSTLTLSASVPFVNGVTFWRDQFWLSGADADSSSALKNVVPVARDGTVKTPAMQYRRTGFNEGIDRTDSTLLLVHSTGGGQGVVYELTPLDFVAGGGIRVGSSALSASDYVGGGTATGLTRFTTWTIGVSALFSTKLGTSMGVSSYTVDGSPTDTNRASIAWRQGTDRLGIWNDADSWLEATGAPSTSTHYRLHDVHEGTTSRKFYQNGTLQGTDATITAMPVLAANAIYLGYEDSSAAQSWRGDLGFLYLRPSVLTADWIAAETSNLSNPSAFYGVTGTGGSGPTFSMLLVSP